MSNVIIDSQQKTVSVDTYSTAFQALSYDELIVYYACTNGSATAGHLLDLTDQGCDEDSDTLTDWVNLVADDAAAWTQITGTSGANAWPKSYCKKFSTFPGWHRFFIDVTNGTWTIELVVIGRN
jgi:hypothetical protein